MPITIRPRAAFGAALAAVLLPLLISNAAGAAEPAIHVKVDCKAGGAECPPPPPPPPAPKAPLPPPAQAGREDDRPADAPAPPPPPPLDARPPGPSMPGMPRPPQLPPVPAAAHAACAGQAEGREVVVDLRPGHTLHGECAKRDGKMVFKLKRFEMQAPEGRAKEGGAARG